MAKEQIDGFRKDNIKKKSRNPIINFNQLQMYLGKDYVIDEEDTDGIITITQPSIGWIADIGEERFFASLNILITNTTSYKSFLWDLGLNWNELSDFELFTVLYQNIDEEVSKELFNGLVFTNFKPFQVNDKIVLYDETTSTEINENVYFHISQYLRNVFKIFPEEKFTTSKTMQEWYIRKDKREQENSEKKEETNSYLQSVISACINHPGFKYKLDELYSVKVCQFYDSVQRLQIYENTTALLKGMFSGFVDSSGIKPEEYNFMREI